MLPVRVPAQGNELLSHFYLAYDGALNIISRDVVIYDLRLTVTRDYNTLFFA